MRTWLQATATLALALGATGCSQDPIAAWAFDPIHLEPDGDGVYGFQTWEFYSRRWTKTYNDKHYLCALVVELEGTPAPEPCERCDYAWDLTTSLVETDCAQYLAEEPGFLSLARVGIGEPGPDLNAEDPYPGQTSGGFVDYGDGLWEPHGWAYASSLDTRGTTDSLDWNGSQSFTLWPAYIWDMEDP